MKIPKVIGMEFVEWRDGFGFAPILSADTKIYRAVSFGRIRPEVPEFAKAYYGNRECYVITHWYSFVSDGDLQCGE